MQPQALLLAAVAAGTLVSCSGSNKPAASAAPQSPATAPPRITQFYATAPKLARGEKELICYGVENAKTVHLEPPRQELSAALARCVEVNPTGTTTYKLTAEGDGGPPASQELTVSLGPAHVKIVDVTVSALSVKPGDLVNICVHAQNAAAIEITPLHFHAASRTEACTTDSPRKTTTYSVTATGPGGDQDHEHVTVKVQ